MLILLKTVPYTVEAGARDIQDSPYPTVEAGASDIEDNSQHTLEAGATDTQEYP